ncbi:hypothetical protein EXIGLDRAFT_373905 [Exidia glandulosa HHB12029]|uniref:Uncharacterized protein n=1 Tax=Exidia glandulosa HHB12029 TaxID=1314781 RepID=A0A165PY61_EXIGL|nr:hypothetical protein EXIGLDRAFT_373905 [Exidia glandulosa HHB12029]
MDPVGTTQLAAKGVGEVVRVGHQHNTAQQQQSNTDRVIAAEQKAEEVAESARRQIAEANRTNQSAFFAEKALDKAQEVTAHADHAFKELAASAESSNPVSSVYHTARMTGDRKKAEAGAKQARLNRLRRGR